MTLAFGQSQRLQSLPHGLSLELCYLDDDRDITLSSAEASLSPGEHARVMRFRFDRDRTRHIRGRGFMRRALGRHMGVAAADVPLTVCKNGKPTLSCQGPGFNLSHSGTIAVLAIRDDGPVGVDIELADRIFDSLSVARGCLQDHEFAVLVALPDMARRRRFLDFWTAKEALMKLTGEGMNLDPKCIALRLEAGVPCGFDAPTVHRAVKLDRLSLGPGQHIAVAWEQS